MQPDGICPECERPLEPSEYSSQGRVVFHACEHCNAGREDGEELRGHEAADLFAAEMARMLERVK